MKFPPGRTIVVGSFNPRKAAEMAGLLKDFPLAVRPLTDFPNVQPVPETGNTFAENAREKALGLAEQLASADILGVVADDSGIEVDALGGRPGVLSARYVSKTATDPERVQRLLEELGDRPAEQRTARFRCVVALANREKIWIQTEGTVEGRIGQAPAGTFGFGYDPVFIPQGYERTFAGLGPEVKHKISHRAVAIRRFRERLARMFGPPSRT